MEDRAPRLVRQIWWNRWCDRAELKACDTRGGYGLNNGYYSLSCIFESLQEDFRWVFSVIYGSHSNSEKIYGLN